MITHHMVSLPRGAILPLEQKLVSTCVRQEDTQMCCQLRRYIENTRPLRLRAADVDRAPSTGPDDHHLEIQVEGAGPQCTSFPYPDSGFSQDPAVSTFITPYVRSINMLP